MQSFKRRLIERPRGSASSTRKWKSAWQRMPHQQQANHGSNLGWDLIRLDKWWLAFKSHVWKVAQMVVHKRESKGMWFSIDGREVAMRNCGE